MATRKETVDYFLQQMAHVGDLNARKMFGEYGIYHRDVLVALACDDRLFIKPTEAGRVFEAECEPTPPYPGAKPSWRVSDGLLEDPERLAEFVRVTYRALAQTKKPAKPAPKKGRSRKTNTKNRRLERRENVVNDAVTVRSGRCLCGNVRFETRGEPRFISNCHCESCRRASSAPSVTWAGFSDAQVTMSGETLRRFESSPGVTRYFCGACGSPLAFKGDRWAGETHIPVCAFDTPEALSPQSDHFENEKLPWAALLGAHAPG